MREIRETAQLKEWVGNGETQNLAEILDGVHDALSKLVVLYE